MKKKILVLLMILFVMFAFSSCVPGDGVNNADHLAGFWWGVWHGIIAPITLIIGLFKKNIKMYEVYNVGWWYDLGFYIAVVSGLGGGAAATSRRHD